jgi:peptidoglycan hydrolase-like protein with peptidoglycan-binding domain
MTPLKARLTLFAVAGIFLATAANALFLQDRARLHRLADGPTTAVSVTHFPLDKPSEAGNAPSAKPQNGSSKPRPGEHDPRLFVALQRELSRKGYEPAAQPKTSGLRAALLAYEYDSGLQLTGEPTEALLKRLLFDLNPAPRGLFADRAEADAKLVLETQKTLLELGFFSGTLSGRMDVWTANAVKAFERHRGLPLTGRLGEITLLELISYSGQPLRRAAE